MLNPTGFRSLLNQIIVRLEKTERVTKGGVHLTDHETDILRNGSYSGFLVDVGPDCFPDDKFGAFFPTLGEKVFFRRYAGEHVTLKHNGEIYRTMTDECLCGIIREPTEDNPTGIVPLLDRSLVRVKKYPEKIGSIIIPEATREDRKWYEDRGEIVAMAPNAFPAVDYPVLRPEIGEQALFAAYSGISYEHGDEFYRMLREQEIVAVEKQQS